MFSSGSKIWFFQIMFHCTIFYFFICIYCCFAVMQISSYFSESLFYCIVLYGHFFISNVKYIYKRSIKSEYIWLNFILMLSEKYCRVILFWNSAFHVFQECFKLYKSDFFFCKKIRHFVVTKFFIFSILLLVLIVLLVVLLLIPRF